MQFSARGGIYNYFPQTSGSSILPSESNLLLEDNDKVLLEDDDQILLEA